MIIYKNALSKASVWIYDRYNRFVCLTLMPWTRDRLTETEAQAIFINLGPSLTQQYMKIERKRFFSLIYMHTIVINLHFQLKILT